MEQLQEKIKRHKDKETNVKTVRTKQLEEQKVKNEKSEKENEDFLVQLKKKEEVMHYFPPTYSFLKEIHKVMAEKSEIEKKVQEKTTQCLEKESKEKEISQVLHLFAFLHCLT